MAIKAHEKNKNACENMKSIWVMQKLRVKFLEAERTIHVGTNSSKR